MSYTASLIRSISIFLLVTSNALNISCIKIHPSFKFLREPVKNLTLGDHGSTAYRV